jgi:hypothetical protein
MISSFLRDINGWATQSYFEDLHAEEKDMQYEAFNPF